MSTIDYKSEIKESAKDLGTRLKNLSSPLLRNRCEVLLWLKTGKMPSMLACMRLKGMSKTTGTGWWQLYRSKGLDSLLSTDHKGQTSVLDDHSGLWDRLTTEGFSTIKEARDWLFQEYGISYTENGLGNYFRRRKVKLKTGRPHHPNRSEEEREAYQKKI